MGQPKSLSLTYSGLKTDGSSFKVKDDSQNVAWSVNFHKNSASLNEASRDSILSSFHYNEQDITNKNLIPVQASEGSYVKYTAKIITPHCWRVERVEKGQPNRIFIAGKLGQDYGVYEKLTSTKPNAHPARVAKLVTKFYQTKFGTLQFEKNYSVSDEDVLVLTLMFTTSVHLGKVYQSALAKRQQDATGPVQLFNLVCVSEGGDMNFLAGSSGAGASSSVFYNGTGIENPDDKLHRPNNSQVKSS